MKAQRHLTRGIVVLLGTAAAAAAWAIGGPLAGADMDVRLESSGPVDHINLRAVVVTALAAGLLGWLLLAVLERVTRRPRRTWTTVAVVAALASLGGPIAGGLTTGTTVALCCVHLAAAAVMIPGLAGTVCDVRRGAAAE